MNFEESKIALERNGHAVLNELYSAEEIERMVSAIDQAEQNDHSFLKTNDLFAIRQLLKNIPQLAKILFTLKLKTLVHNLLGPDSFLTKAIYFDKPSESNWFVAYHQDLSISVTEKAEVDNYLNWTFKKGQHAVQPPLEVLEDTVTIRIHLDHTDADNGALKVISGSHLKGIVRANSKDWDLNKEVVCDVERGGAMLMKPLTLHASNRTKNGKKRRVIHLEFNQHKLTKPLQWLEKCGIHSYI